MSRIPGSGPTVFMQHGLEDSSATWVLAGPEHGAPGFRLAEAGYDVWLGNFRGNNYARQHVTLQPSDKEFWRFTWDEMAKYDLPAMLNYTLEYTGKEKIHYVGHSMGTTTYMAMNSVDQSWADRVELAVLLAPVAYMDNMESPLRYLTPFFESFDVINHFSMFLSSVFQNSKFDQHSLKGYFLAPSGAQGVTIFVRPFVRSSVRPSGPSLSRALILHLLASDSSG